MSSRSAKLNRYLFMIGLSIVLGLIRYYVYTEDNFTIFKLQNKNNEKDEVNLEHIEKIKQNLNLVFSINKDASYDDVNFLHSNELAIFIDARDKDEIEKEGQILNSENIPVSKIKLVLEGDRDEYGDCIFKDNMSYISPDICGYEDVLDKSFDRFQDASEDFPDAIFWINKLKQLDRKLSYVVYCGSSDCDKSEDLYGYMTEYMDFDKVMKFKGGWEVWKKKQENKDD